MDEKFRMTKLSVPRIYLSSKSIEKTELKTSIFSNVNQWNLDDEFVVVHKTKEFSVRTVNPSPKTDHLIDFVSSYSSIYLFTIILCITIQSKISSLSHSLVRINRHKSNLFADYSISFWKRTKLQWKNS